MSDREELEALRRLSELEARARVGNIQASWDANNPITGAKTVAIAAGRQADKTVAGVKELGLSANVAAREALGMQSGDQLRELAQLEAQQTQNDALYQPLKEKHPFLTGAGESAFLAGVPMGQATMAGRIAAPALVAGANELVSYGSPQERASRAVKTGVTSAAGGVFGEGVRTLVSPAKSMLTRAQQDALQRASDTIGYQPRASELTGSETLRRIEDAVARQPGGAGPMRDLIQANRVAVNRTAAGGMGETADQITSPVFESASDRLGDTYKTLRSRANMPVTSDIFDAITRSEKMLNTGDVAGPKKTALETLGRLKDQLYATKQFDGQTYQSWTSDLGALGRTLGKENRTAAAALREVEKAMDKVARGADAPIWQKADQEYAAMEMLMKPRVVNEATGDVSPRNLASQMERQLGKNMKTGKIQGPLADIAALGRALPEMAEGSQTAGREAFGNLPGWLLAVPNYGMAKALTSGVGRDYLSKGLLANPAASRRVGGLLGRAAVPLSIAEIEMLMLGYQ